MVSYSWNELCGHKYLGNDANPGIQKGRNIRVLAGREKFGEGRSGRFPAVHDDVISGVFTVGDGQTAGPSTPQIISYSDHRFAIIRSGRGDRIEKT